MMDNKISKGELYEKYLKRSLKRKVDDSNVSVAKIAERLGKSVPSVYRYIDHSNGRPVNINTVIDILNTINEDETEFFIELDKTVNKKNIK
ncbi:hypothetical protein [uncultured Anaerococcus sp.]|uniref:hypothetical protein n=1 Tax=uncultured Anaerococcus sp. TaxID=293428 RepID=UPI0025DDB8AF|nr:hypothetical protein [uncultured Anaerococcus sp.]